VSAGGKKTVVDADTSLRGTLSSACPVVVLGRIDGELHAPAVEISAGGVVAGQVKAGAIASRGELAGTVEADTIRLAGQVRDGTVIRAGSLDVQLSVGVSFGDCQLEVGELPSRVPTTRPG
jgi:cytoskeletal protein CcmA (bactofilin family)